MKLKTLFMPEDIADYVGQTWVREPEILRELREETALMVESGMQIGPEQGRFMALILQLMGAKRIIEIGTFTGYSALTMALAVPEAKIECFDVSETYTSVARRYWDRAGVSNISLTLGPALETLAHVEGPVDVAFIDADKPSYDGYYERCLQLVRPGGLIMIDNVLWHGQIANMDDVGESTVALRALNAKIMHDPRVDICLASVGDGMTMARVR